MKSRKIKCQRLKYAATINDEVLTEDTHPEHELQYVDISNVDSSGNINEITIDWFKHELFKFKETLEENFNVDITDNKLRNAIIIYKRYRYVSINQVIMFAAAFMFYLLTVKFDYLRLWLEGLTDGVNGRLYVKPSLP